MYTVHSANMTPETRELFRTYKRLREEGRDNVFIEDAADVTEREFKKKLEREMVRFLYRIYSPRTDEPARSGLTRTCNLARLIRDARLGKNDKLFS